MVLLRYNYILDPLIRSGFIYVIAGILILVTFIWPLWGLTAFLAWIPAQALFPAEGLAGSVTKGFGLVVLVASSRNIFNRIERIFYSKEVYIYLSFVAWSFFSILWSHNQESCFFKNLTYLQLFLLYLLIITSTDRQHYPLLLKGFVIGALLSIFTIPFSAGAQDIFYLRAAGGGLDENEYASTIAVALVLALTWIQLENKLWKKIIPLTFIPLGLLAIAYTKSRTGTFALLPFVLFLGTVFKNKGMGIKILIILIVSASVLTLFYFMPEGYIDRVVDINKRAGHRFQIWSVGIKIIINNFLIGVGSGNFAEVFSKYAGNPIASQGAVAHNSFISVFGELGIIGLSLFFWLFYGHIKDLFIFIKNRNNTDRDRLIAKGLLVALSTFLIASLGISWEYNKLLPILLGLILLLVKSEG